MTDLQIHQAGSPSQHDEKALEQAAQLLESTEDEVVAGIISLLDSSKSPVAWDAKHTSNALRIISEQATNHHSAKVLEIEARERLAARNQLPILVSLALIGTIGISWMFLEFGKPEFIAAIIAGLGGFLGGYGTAFSKSRDRARN